MESAGGHDAGAVAPLENFLLPLLRDRHHELLTRISSLE